MVKLKGIVFSHGHLDHIGAVAKLAHRYDIVVNSLCCCISRETKLKGERKFKVNNPINFKSWWKNEII